jgi:oligoendopeptidase F
MAKAQKSGALLPRNKVKSADTWNLASLFKSDKEWEAAFGVWSGRVEEYGRFKGHLSESARVVAELMVFDREFNREGERLGVYASLKVTEDQSNSEYLRMRGRFEHTATKAGEAAAFIRPELMKISPARMEAFLGDEALREWKLALERVLRYRPHTLSDGEERLLAMQTQMAGAASQAFSQLNNADMKFGTMKDDKGRKIELGHGSYSSMLNSPKRAVRKTAFHQYYGQFDAHKNTIAATLDGSVKRDVYYAQVRNFKTAREASLFDDNVPVAVYDNLVSSVRKNLPVVHKYLEVRRKAMKLKDVHQYDTYVPIIADLKKRHTWEEASKLVVDALEPLGSEYCKVLKDGLGKARWCDRYPNQGKRSGAFSSGSYGAMPYILMNYQEDVLDHVFTLAHEAGHSMHTWYAAKSQPFQYYDYTIFVAEVASTFNEQLLARHLLAKAKGKKERAYLINRLIDGIRGTIVRQTMFAEFEVVTHALVEAGEPLTVEALRREYRKLLDAYFGPKFVVDDLLELECLRIPHFYSAFYVYKYATGLSAAIALSQRVLKGGKQELDDYLGFLKGGSSKWSLDLLRSAGVDMERPEPVDTALTHFGQLVDELEELLK